MRNAKVLIFGECFARRGVKLFKFERLVADENQITPVTDHERLMLLRGWLGIGTWCSFFFGLTLRLLSGLDFCLGPLLGRKSDACFGWRDGPRLCCPRETPRAPS